jgi:hydroxymethylglutaryl-CoA lyase
VTKARIIEVGPRDGLQNEPELVPTSDKVAFIDALGETGLRELEITSFVSPRWVPQLADAEEVNRRILRHPHMLYSALVPNEHGLERAMVYALDKVAVFTGATESFTRENINTSIDGSFARFAPVVRRAREAAIGVRGYVSVAFQCPFEGRTEPGAVLAVVRRMLELGVDEISLGDTLGRASADDVERLLEKILAEVAADLLILHFHDTFGGAAANVRVAWRMGVRSFDSSAGGLGGCPYAPAATGNIATETLVRTLEQLGGETGVDVAAVSRASQMLGPRVCAGGTGAKAKTG